MRLLSLVCLHSTQWSISNVCEGAWLRSPHPQCVSEMDWRRQRETKGVNPDSDGSASPSEAKRPSVDLSSSVDNIEMFGATDGGTLTRKSIENCQRTLSPAIEAEERLQSAVNEAGSLSDSAAAAAMLQAVIGDAYAAGVSVSSPQMRKAAALLTVIEQAASAEEAPDVAAPLDPHLQQMNAIFSDDYAMPDFELE